VVIGPARPGTVLPVLAAASGLAAREQQVIRCVFVGYSTREIAGLRHVSGCTVQVHLKAVFGKVGVTSRGALSHPSRPPVRLTDHRRSARQVRVVTARWLLAAGDGRGGSRSEMRRHRRCPARAGREGSWM
jgi:DNA-binding CsgD family transcriptional regulator